MAKEKLSEDMEEKVSGGSNVGDLFKKPNTISVVNTEVEHECSWCHKKFKVAVGMCDFPCPHCGYGGYKSAQGWQDWYEKHKDDKK